MTRVTSDVETLNELFSSGVVTIFGDVFTLVAIMVMMLAIDLKLALVTFAVIPLVWLTASDIPPASAGGLPRHPLPAGPAQRLSPGAAFRHADGAALRARGGDPPAASASSIASICDAHLRSITVYAIFFPVVEVLTAVAMALLLWYGGLRVLERHPDRRRAGGLHPVHPALLPAAPGPFREVQPAPERDGVVGTGVRACSTSR